MLSHGEAVVTTAGTRVKLASSSIAGGKVIVQAKAGNTGLVFLGGPAVSSTSFGISLAAGVQSQPIDVDDLSSLYVDAANNGSGVTYLATS